jgi:hypothetical protein
LLKKSQIAVTGRNVLPSFLATPLQWQPPELNCRRAITDLQQQVSALDEEPGNSLVDDLPRQFPPLTAKRRDVLVASLQDCLRSQKKSFLYVLIFMC